MAFLKFSRDKRGYEHFYLVQPTNRGKGRPRVLYWFRTPPNIKVGRSPFDTEVQRALEAQNPGVSFDWDTIVHTPIPPPAEAERWRERRRVERALRASDIEDAVVPADAAEVPSQAEIHAAPPETATTPAQVTVESVEPSATIERPAPSNTTAPGSEGQATGGERSRHRRRRRRGRHKPPVQGPQGSGETEP